MDHDPVTNIESLGWNDLVLLKRKYSASIREVTQEIIDIDNNKLPRVNQEIHEQKIGLNRSVVKSRQNRLGIQSANSDLLAISEKIHQSKNFLGMMQGRLPQEKEESLMRIAKFNESLINGGKYSSAREKDRILSLVKDATMKIDALKAFRTIKEQLQPLECQCEVTKKSIRTLDDEYYTLQREISRCKSKIKNLFDSKHEIIAERADLLLKYNGISIQLDKINAQLDIIAGERRRQKQDNFRAVYNVNISEAKDSAKKKLQSGSKLSLEELRLLYDENED
ncbi:hypothetical protein BH18THE2_BH18THE2_02720 [soil metagenome]